MRMSQFCNNCHIFRLDEISEIFGSVTHLRKIFVIRLLQRSSKRSVAVIPFPPAVVSGKILRARSINSSGSFSDGL